MSIIKRNIVDLPLAIITSILCILGLFFVYFTSTYFNGGILLKYRFLIILALFLIVLGVTGAFFVLYFMKKETWYRSLFSLLILVDFLLMTFLIVAVTGFLNVIHDANAFEEYLETNGRWMDVIFIVLQLLQVVILPLPSFITLVAGTALFGPVKCFIYSYIGIVLGSIIAFFIGRLLGQRAVEWMLGKDTVEKWNKKIKGKDYVLFTAMFILPLFPDDVLCFLAGLSTMSNRYFIGMILIARAISVASTCFSVKLLPINTWWGILGWGVIFVSVAVALFVFYKKQDAIIAWFKKFSKRRVRK